MDMGRSRRLTMTLMHLESAHDELGLAECKDKDEAYKYIEEAHACIAKILANSYGE